MNKLSWFLCTLFAGHLKSEQERIDWWWWLNVDLPYWWETRPFVVAFQHCAQWTLAHVRRKDGSSDDDIPF